MIKKALISVSDKTGLVELGKGLSDLGIEILSTGGTAQTLKDAGIPVTMVSDYTGSPEILDGRVKTLHPKIHGGILAVRNNPRHMKQLEENGIDPIDLVVVNLYPFEEVIERDDADPEEIIENIDIGGPSMVRSAAKNFEFVTVVTSPKDYEKVLKELQEHGETSLELREKLSWKAFSRTYHYDEAIDHYFRSRLGEAELLDLHYEKVQSLRYGENPHQKAAFFRNPINRDSNITNAKMLQGKHLSFNNIVDGDSALELVKEFSRPTVAVIKHNNPCGVASGETIEDAFEAAYGVDSMSSFGGVIALNRSCNKAIVDSIFEKKWFVEIIIAPHFDEDVVEMMKSKPKVRLLEVGELKLDVNRRDIKKVAGGILVQTQDTYKLTADDLKVVSKKKPTEEQIQSMLFASKIVKHVKSNAIVLAKGEVVQGIGAGQMSRVDAVHLACYKAGERAKGSVMASDAFFPFADGIEMAHEHGVEAVIQPGGSIKDDEVIKRVDELGMAMVFTGVRFFRH
ncbi:bifunctional phosphoribosylaminoimidazolecarboxamide formyltransferase/IMP cyclohydrolase [Candidatus Peregrinibacteria bacterium]|nr:bifunctional phosphoribosylaminoimidazolecarboxamide formyltransferase/IMP cyclohydrolase [Candidatus Peregrinibacteria bacterium]